jgi:hypothetical protein
MGARPVSTSRGLHILGLMQAPVSPSDSILVSLPLCFKLEHLIIYVSLLQLKNLCNNSLFGPCMRVLCVNTSLLAPITDPG